MLLGRFGKRSLIGPLKFKVRLLTSNTKAEPVFDAILEKSEIYDDYRQEQLLRLQSIKPADFSPISLNLLIADFLVSPKKPDTLLAGKLMDKFLFKIPGIDENGDLTTLYLLQLIDGNEIGASADFLKRLLLDQGNEKDGRLVPVTSFMMELVWRAIINSKSDSIGFDLLQALKSTEKPTFGPEIDKFLSTEFSETLLLDLFLPRLNWKAIDFIISKSTATNEQGHITISSSVLQEIFHVLLNPIPNDPYHGTLETEPFTSNLVNPRFHRLIELLERWKNISGISIKGKQMAKALEDTFKRFLPTESMMDQLQKLA